MPITFIDIFVVLILLVIAFLYLKKQYNEVDHVVSKHDNRVYITRKLPDKQRAADMLAEINEDLQALISHLVAKFPNDSDIRKLYDKYNPDAISEGGNEHGYTSYSINKGEKIVLCIRQKDTNEFVDKNIVMYVAIHELAHIMTSDIGHTNVFWANFKRILTEAIAIGVYKRQDFAKQPQNYCGIKITSSIV